MNPFEDDIRERNANLRNRPQFMPGQSDDEDDEFFSSNSFDDDDLGMMGDATPRYNANAAANPFASQGGGSPFGPLPMGGGPVGSPSPFGSPIGGPVVAGPMGMQGNAPRQQDNRTVEDKFWDGAAAVGKTAKTFLQAVQECVQGRDYTSLIKGSKAVLISSAACAVCSVIFAILHLFLPLFNNWFGMLVGSGLASVVGFLGYALWLDKAEEEDRERHNAVPQNPFPATPAPSPMSYQAPPSASESFDFGTINESDFEINLGSGDEEPEEPDEPEPEPIPAAVPVEQAISEIPFVTPHTQTRSFLYEQYVRVLPKISPKFYEMQPIDMDSRLFNECQNYLNVEADAQGIPEEQWPVMTDMTENGFLYQIKFESGIRAVREKSEKYAESVANQMSIDANGYPIEKYEGMYGQGLVVGRSVILRIFKGKASNSMISLGDCLATPIIKDYVLDLNNSMPVVYGVNEQGSTNKVDFSKNESFLLAGEPRSGKSWQSQNILVQMCMWNSPKDLIFEIFDVKGAASDYTLMMRHLPHFRIFRNDPQGIVDRLEYLVEVEANRRRKILNENGVINIKELHELHPEVNLPYLYIVIDEMASLMKQLEDLDIRLANGKKNNKEYTNKYKGYLQRLTTELAFSGMRLILVPHRLIESIIPKTSYELCNARQCVRTSAKELKSSLGVTEKTFPYSLVLPGDMAITDKQIMSGRVVFNHGLAVSKTNQMNENIYKFIGSIWKQFEPDYKPHTEQLTQSALIHHDYIDIDYGKTADPAPRPQPAPTNNYTGPVFSNEVEASMQQDSDFTFSNSLLNDSMFDDMDFS